MRPLATPADAYARAFACDTVSAFGGIVAFHGACDAEAADAMADVFTEVVVAPSFTEDALAAFAERQNLRVVRAPLPTGGGLDVRTAPGRRARAGRRRGRRDAADEWKVVSSREPTAGRVARPRVRVDRRAGA